MEPIKKAKLDKTVLRVPTDVKESLASGMSAYDMAQVMGNTINEQAANTNAAIEYVNETSETLEENEQERIENEIAREEAETERATAFEELNERSINTYNLAKSAADEIDVALNGTDDPEKGHAVMMTNFAAELVRLNEYVVSFKESDAKFLSRFVHLKENMSVQVVAAGGEEVTIEMYRVVDEGSAVVTTGTHLLRCETARNGQLLYNVTIEGNYLFAFSDGEDYVVKPDEYGIPEGVTHNPAATLYVKSNGLHGLQDAVGVMSDKLDENIALADNNKDRLDGLTIEKEEVPSDSAVLDQWQFYDKDHAPIGAPIKTYKDRFIQSITFDAREVEGKKKQYLVITYINEKGVSVRVDLDLSQVVIEAEVGVGLKVEDNGVISLALATDGESHNYLHIDAAGNLSVHGLEEYFNRNEGEHKTSAPYNLNTRWGIFDSHEESRVNATANILKWDDTVTSLQGQVAALNAKAELTLSMNPSVIEIGVATSVAFTGNLTSTSGLNANELKLYADNTGTTALKSVTNAKNISHTASYTLNAVGDKTFVVTANISGGIISKSAKLYGRYATYCGFGASYSAVVGQGKRLVTSAAGTYTGTASANGVKYYILVPTGTTVPTSFTMNATPFVMNNKGTQTINSVSYTVLESGSTFNSGGNVNIVAS